MPCSFRVPLIDTIDIIIFDVLIIKVYTKKSKLDINYSILFKLNTRIFVKILMLNSKYNIVKIQQTLKAIYPDVKTRLVHKSPFQLLIATILSAQCTDIQVNLVTKKLFKKMPKPKDFANASLKDIEKFIYSTGFYKKKRKT